MVDRQAAVEAISAGKTQLLVCTDAAARGLDFNTVREGCHAVMIHVSHDHVLGLGHSGDSI